MSPRYNIHRPTTKVACYFCHHPQTRVLPWRSRKKGFEHLRRRECYLCFGVFQTGEHFDKVVQQPRTPAA